MKVIGITGSFGTGKTFVSLIFKSLGAKVLDADKMAHDAIIPGAPAYRKIVSIFGKEILGSGRKIARPKLAEKVFKNKRSLERINKIIHPYVIKSIKERIERAGQDDIIIIDAPLLVEANLAGLVDVLIVVRATRKNQIARCGKKFCISREDVVRRIANQISLGKKMKLADFVIDNSGPRSRTREQVKKVWRKIVWK